jgi:hypothetical protein
MRAPPRGARWIRSPFIVQGRYRNLRLGESASGRSQDRARKAFRMLALGRWILRHHDAKCLKLNCAKGGTAPHLRDPHPVEMSQQRISQPQWRDAPFGEVLEESRVVRRTKCSKSHCTLAPPTRGPRRRLCWKSDLRAHGPCHVADAHAQWRPALSLLREPVGPEARARPLSDRARARRQNRECGH